MNDHQLRLKAAIAKAIDQDNVSLLALDEIEAANYPDAICEELTRKFGTLKAKTLIEGAHCGKLGKISHILKEGFKKSLSLSEFSRLHDQINPHVRCFVEDNSLYLVYPRCYCPHVKNLKLALPEVWCQCTKGYVKEIYGYIFNKEINPLLIESIKMGSDKCLIRIDLCLD
jgi:hypothetical protein